MTTRIASPAGQLNYQHLLYFWSLARAGSLAAAAKGLGLAIPTISAQIKALEGQLDVHLVERAGRRLVLTDAGRVALRYADEIFGLGRELVDVLHERPVGRPMRLVVGLTFVLPKASAVRLLQPALELPVPVQLEIVEGELGALVARLATHELDVVLADTPHDAASPVKAFSHPLGGDEVWFFAAPALAAQLGPFPRALDGAPVVLPRRGCALRQELDRWFASHGLAPRVVAEVDDAALATAMADAGLGVCAGPSALVESASRPPRLAPLGRAGAITERFFAISLERRVAHPGVVAVCQAARPDAAAPLA